MKCPGCTFDNPEGMAFCGKCGMPLAPACPQCGFENPAAFAFCGKCGTALADRPAEPEPTATADAERRQLTVLFCDLVGSTALASRLDPEDMRDVLRAYQDACSGVIGRYDGYIAKYMGDGVYAYFGYPQAHEDDAERAITAGLGIVEAVAGLEYDLGVRIGVATGNVAVGDLIGEGASEEANVVGEAPNLAARLQAIAEPNTVVIGEATHALAGGMFETTDLGSQDLNGFSDPIGAWVVLNARASESRFQATRGEHLTDLIGREEELDTLMRRWQRAKKDEGQVVLISGEPGIGKSRLSQALQNEIIGEPHTRLRYQCSPYHTNSAFYPIIEQLERGAGFEAGDGCDVKLDKLEAALAQSGKPVEDTARLIASLLSVPADDRYPALDVSPQRHKELTLNALVEQLVGLAEQLPVLFVFEDAHWIDPTTQELLEMMVERVPEAAVLMLITYRPEFDAPWVGRPRVTPMILSRLERRDCALMVENVAKEFGIETELRDRIATQTDGVPLFIEELTRSVLETATGSTGAIEVPATLQDSLEARLDRLGPAKEIAQLGAVVGRTFDYDLLSHIAGLDEAALSSALEVLVGSGLVSARGTPPNAAYNFKHALVQETSYNSLLRGRRAEIHQRIGQALEESFPEIAETKPETLAHHFTEATVLDSAVSYWRRAASRAMARSAAVEAVAHLEKGLDLLGDLPEAPERDEKELDLRSEILAPLFAATGPRSAKMGHALTRAYELCEKLGDKQRIFPVLFGRYTRHLARGQSKEVANLAKEFYRRAEQSGNHGFCAVGCRMVGAALFREGSLTSAREYLEQVEALYDFEQHRNLVSTFGIDAKSVGLANHAAVMWLLGYPVKAKISSAGALTHAQLVNHATSTGISLFLGGIIFFNLLHDHTAVSEHTAGLLDLAEKFGNPLLAHIGHFHSGWSEILTGHLEDGIKHMEESFSEPDDPTGFIHWSWHATLLATALGQAGQFDKAIE